MKNFIEITDNFGKKHLINVRHIEEVCDSTIYMNVGLKIDNKDIQDFYNCRESYEEIKTKIEEAECGIIFCEEEIEEIEVAGYGKELKNESKNNI